MFDYKLDRLIAGCASSAAHRFESGSLMSARAFILALLMCPLAAHAQEATTIFYHGKIVTVDPQFRVVDSMAIRGDRIVGVGARQEVAKFAGPNAIQIDLQGKTVLPGLIDSHVHAADAAMYEFDHPVPEMETIGDVLGYIKSRAVIAKEGDWIELTQVFVTRLRDQRFPTCAELDAAAPRNPVYFGTGPDASVNSMALKLSGIDKNFHITDGKPGRIERDATASRPAFCVIAAGFSHSSLAKRSRPTRTAASA
jgi:predicted amidohydrolase YtcJ